MFHPFKISLGQSLEIWALLYIMLVWCALFTIVLVLDCIEVRRAIDYSNSDFPIFSLNLNPICLHL